VRRLGHVRALDGIRGVGAVSVILAHYFNYTPGGFYSIEVFFGLSGFLITALLLEEHDRLGRIALLAFYRRRAYRLLPAVFTVIAAYAVVMWASPVIALERILAGGFYAANLVLAAGSHLLENSPFWPFWSLAEEEQFYLVWPILLLLILRRGVRESRIAAGLGCIVVALSAYGAVLGLTGSTATRIYYAPDTHSAALTLGCLLALLWRAGLRVPQPIGWLALAALVGGSSLATRTATVAYLLPLMATAATLFVGAALEPGILSRFLSWRPVVWVGLISYGLYVWHFFFLWLFDWHAPFVSLALTLAAATFSYYGIEKPLRARLRSRRATPEIQPSASLSARLQTSVRHRHRLSAGAGAAERA
jgi:peptidoglycan/LPS O-acetylase OafA/YrhL